MGIFYYNTYSKHTCGYHGGRKKTTTTLAHQFRTKVFTRPSSFSCQQCHWLLHSLTQLELRWGLNMMDRHIALTNHIVFRRKSFAPGNLVKDDLESFAVKISLLAGNEVQLSAYSYGKSSQMVIIVLVQIPCRKIILV
mmetsp:Transcript_36547/g.56146  ORF Transcript_36547/g.56146 Transcript_36547/m.56146 type:complete len:138 (-) Transcript_36547:42-455(-)